VLNTINSSHLEFIVSLMICCCSLQEMKPKQREKKRRRSYIHIHLQNLKNGYHKVVRKKLKRRML